MLDFEKLAELLFPHITQTPEDIEKSFPQRQLPEGAKVTRFAPSPTGFVHFGGLFPSTVGERLAHQSGGVFYLRIEDTDAKREVEGAAEGLIKTLAKYGISFLCLQVFPLCVETEARQVFQSLTFLYPFVNLFKNQKSKQHY